MTSAGTAVPAMNKCKDTGSQRLWEESVVVCRGELCLSDWGKMECHSYFDLHDEIFLRYF